MGSTSWKVILTGTSRASSEVDETLRQVTSMVVTSHSQSSARSEYLDEDRTPVMASPPAPSSKTRMLDASNGTATLLSV